MNKLCLICALMPLALGAPLAQAAAAPGGLDKISVYAGTWKGETEHFNTPYSKAGKETAEIRNDCWRSGDYYACHQFVNNKSAALLVFTYDAAHDLYHSYAIPADGGKPGLGGKLIIKGNTWTFPWEYAQDGKTTYFRVVNVFSTSTTIEYRQEYSADEVHWTLMAKGIERKAPWNATARRRAG